MKVEEQRKAIYEAESAIESILDDFAEKAKLHVAKIDIQTITDKDKNVVPALKVNLTVSKLRE